jgi:hypothetical protein
MELFPFEFPARHETHSFPVALLQRCANICGTTCPPSVVIGDNEFMIPVSSMKVGLVRNVVVSAELTDTNPPGNQKIPGI